MFEYKYPTLKDRFGIGLENNFAELIHGFETCSSCAITI
jgi:hypothetical protein